MRIRATDTVRFDGSDAFSDVGEGAVGDGGDIEITSGSLSVTNGAQLIANTAGQGKAGSVRINASGTVSFDGIDRNDFSSAAFSSVKAGAVGDGGNVEITSGSLSVTNGAQLVANTAGQGDAGSVRINASGTVSFDGIDRNGVSSAAFSNVKAGAVGDGGNVEITSGSLSVTNGAQLSASTAGEGKAGSVRISASDTVSFDGVSSNGFSSSAFSDVKAGAVGDGGDIEITTNSLSVTNGAFLFASTFGQGNAGSVRIRTTDIVSFDGGGSRATSSVGIGGVGNGGDIEINTGSLSVSNRAQLSASNYGQGNAGSVRITATDTVRFDRGIAASSLGTGAAGNGGYIDISTNSLEVTNGASLFASTFGQGNAGSVRITASDTVSFDQSYASSNVGAEAVGNGGDIEITTGSLEVTNGASLFAATGGRGNAGSVRITASDTVSFDGVGSIISIDGVGSDTVSSAASSSVVSGGVGNGGDIVITTGSLSVTNGARLVAQTDGQGKAGSVRITASDTVRFDGGGAFSGVGEGAVGNGGDIEITTGSLSVTNGAFLIGSTIGQGNAGAVRISATDTVSFDGGGASSFVGPTGIGDGGVLEITTGSLSVNNGAQLITSTYGQGNAGSIKITATDKVRFAGVGSNGSFSGAFSTVEAGAVGNGGDLVINTDSLEVTKGAFLSASTFGQGNAGSIKITATDVRFAGVGSNGQASGAFSAVASGAEGEGGSIDITSSSLSLTDAFISSVSQGTGTAGDITLQTRQNLQMNRSSILASTQAGDGGNIKLQVGDVLLMRNNSNISTTAGIAGAGGNGGNININADFIVAVSEENSDITANAFNGRGGNINITTQGIYGLEYRERETPLSDITASSQFGVNGEFQLDLLTNVDPSRGLAELPTDVVDATRQIDRRCTPTGGAQERSSFTITGRGGLPPSPNDPLRGEAVVTNWVSLDSDVENNTPPAKTTPSSSAPKRLVEAQGWVINEKGQVVLTASAPNVTPQREWFSPPECNPPKSRAKAEVP